MKTTIARAAVVGALLAAGAAQAQSWDTYRPKESLNFFNYEMSLPVGSFNDKFISETSFRGFGFDARSMMNDHFSVGIGIDWNRYQQTYDQKSLDLGGGNVLSGPVYRYADQFALTGLLHGYLRQGIFLPYAGLRIGGVWTYAYQQSADLSNSDNTFSFILAPEIGATITGAKGASSVGLNVAVRYNWTNAKFFKVSDASAFQFVIGLYAGY